ncbi:MAG: hypothetical protein HOW73_40585 [Polyangiaceae bacterium]|nr:hypothetical protein [Polyangiaceae bacterium]
MTTTSDDWRPTSGGRSLVALVPDYDGVVDGDQKSLLRLGAYDATDENSIFGNLDDGWTAVSESTKKVKDLLQTGTPAQPRPGWLEYTDGDRTRATKGTARDAVQGDYKLYVKGDALMDVGGKWVFRIGSGTVETWNADPVYYINFYQQPGLFTAGKPAYRKTEMGHVAADSYWFGDTETFYGGFKFDCTFGLTMAAFVGGKFDVNATLGASFNFGYAFELGAVYKYSNVLGKDMHVADDLESKARKSVHLRVKATADGISAALRASVKANTGAAVLAGASAVTAAVSTVIPPVTDSGTAPVVGSLMALSGVGCIAALAWSLVNALKEKAAPKVSATELKMDDSTIVLQQNDVTGATMESKIQLGGGAAPGLVRLINLPGSYLELQSDQDVVLEAAKDMYLQNVPRTSMIKLSATGDINMKATNAQFNGRLQLGPANELTVG